MEQQTHALVASQGREPKGRGVCEFQGFSLARIVPNVLASSFFLILSRSLDSRLEASLVDGGTGILRHFLPDTRSYFFLLEPLEKLLFLLEPLLSL